MSEFLDTRLGILLFLYLLFAFIIGVIAGLLMTLEDNDDFDIIVHPISRIIEIFRDDSRTLFGKCYAIPYFILVIPVTTIAYTAYAIAQVVIAIYKLGFKER